ncbi:MAG: hypothetical protein GXO49_07225 [Chlorobi bacterium]|nr:hypothetical protein [Chlorobiota bacterium]
MKKILILIFITLISNSIFSQKKIEFDSKYLFTTEELGVDIKVLTDSVVFRHENSTMYCDSALLDYGNSFFDAFGNVKIIKLTENSDTVFLYGDTLHYSGEIKLAKVRSNVTLIKDSLTLMTDSLDFDLGTNIGHYFEGGTTINGEDTLKSVYGYYYANEDKLFFKEDVEIFNPRFKVLSDTLEHNTKTKVSYFIGPTEIIGDSNYIYCENGWYDHLNNISQFNQNAYLKNKDQILKGDSLYYDRNIGLGKAYKNVTFWDSVQNVLLQGNHGYYNEKTGYSMMTDSALFTMVGSDLDSLYLHADTLQSYKDTLFEDGETKEYRVIQAFHHVKTYKTDFQSMCDSLIYDLKDSVIQMYINPVLWSDSNQLSADEILIQTYHNQVDRIDMNGNAFIISQSDSIRFNQIYGDDMVAYIDDKKLSQIDVLNNGKAVYFIKDEKNRLIGVNFIECKDMEIYMKDSKVDKIWFFEKPVGKIHPPLTLSKNELMLPNFKWNVDYRPLDKSEVFIWNKNLGQNITPNVAENSLNNASNQEQKDVKKNRRMNKNP